MPEQRNRQNAKDEQQVKQEGLSEAERELQNDPLQEAVEKEQYEENQSR
ncbi:MAG TPA: small acid-soluble spore protein SspJ [Bacillales bacterium]|nr:small acid-soluble spore protein SspJ [Bacillales bacterium]